MAKRPVITPVSVGAASQAINENLNRIAQAFDEVVSRDGSTPNQMEADFDLNSNDLLNVNRGYFSELSIGGKQVNTEVYFSEEVKEISDKVGDLESEVDGLGQAPYQPFSSRSQAESTDINSFIKYISVGGLSYVRDSNGTALTTADGGSWSPLGEVTPEHFGARGDLTFTLQAEGYVRTGGTNDLPAFHAALAWGAARGRRTVANGQYYLAGQLNLVGKLVSETEYGAVLWTHISRLEKGVSIVGSNVDLMGFRLITQYDTADKPANNGHLGSCFTIGEFLEPRPLTLCFNVNVDVRVARAANISGSQRSYPSFLSHGIGHVQGSTIRIGTHGHSNVNSGSLLQFHWGAHYDPATDPGGDDKALATAIETWHPVGNTVEFTTDIDRTASNIGTYFVNSAGGANDIGPVRIRGGKDRLLTLLPGDNVDHFTGPGQAGMPGRGLRIGHIHATGLTMDAASEAAIMVTSRGTSKFENFPGTSIKVIRSLPYDLKIDGIYLETTGGAGIGTARAVRLFGVNGNVDLGVVYAYGFGRAPIDNEYSNCNLTYTLAGADSTLLHNYSNGGRILGTRTKKGDAKTVGSGELQPGWDSDNYAVIIRGDTISGITTTAAVAQYATLIPVTALPQDVHPGDRLTIGGFRVEARGFSDNGTLQLFTTPIPSGVDAGAAVVHERISRVDDATFDFESSEFGCLLDRAIVSRADISRVGFTGRYAFHLMNGSQMTVLGGRMPMMTGLIDGTCYTLRIEPGSHVTLVGSEINHNPRVASHMQLSRAGAGGPWGTATLIGCRINCTLAQLATATVLSESLRLIGCVDANGGPFTLT